MATVQYNNDTSGKCTVTPDTYTRFSKNTTITITASEGYHFTSPFSVYLSWVNVNNTTRTTTSVATWFTETLSADNKTITLDSNTDFNSDIQSITCMQHKKYHIEPDTPSYPTLTLTKNLNNVTMSPDVPSIELDGTSKVITLTADSGYEFSGTPYFAWDRNPYKFEKSENSYVYDLNDLFTKNASIKIYATGVVSAKTKDVIIQLTNCTIIPSFNVMVENETYALTLNANQGFKFVTTPTLSMKNRDNVILDFTKITDYQYTLSFTAESSYFNSNINAVLSGVAVEETPIVNKYGAIQVYKPSTSDMTSLATKRFRENGTVDGVTYSDVDLGSYITQFKRVFFNVVTSAKQNILLGVHDTLINTDTVFNDDVIIDCGTVFIKGANGNELDTKIYKIKIVLPFYEVVELPSIYMNKTIHIVYQANVITGYADILINEVVSNTDLLIVKYRCKISQDLPYILDYDKINSALSDMQLNTSPKIILQKNNTFIDKGYNTYKEDLISNEVGYFEVKDIVSMSVNNTQKEKDLIENLLKSGVYL